MLNKIELDAQKIEPLSSLLGTHKRIFLLLVIVVLSNRLTQ